MLNAAVTFLKNLMGLGPAVKPEPTPVELVDLILAQLCAAADEENSVVVPPGTFALIADNLDCSYTYVVSVAHANHFFVTGRRA